MNRLSYYLRGAGFVGFLKRARRATGRDKLYPNRNLLQSLLFFAMVREGLGGRAMEDVMAQNNSPSAAELVDAAPTAAAPALAGREQQALALVKSYVPWSAGAGLLPLPVVDLAALIAVQLRMLSKLSDIYGVPFVENSVKGVVSSLVGIVVSSGLGAGLGSLIRIVPVVGPLVGMVALPGAYGAATYAIGRVFISHFESGGTFLDFDPQKTRAYFLSEFEKAKVEQPQAA